MCTEQDKTIVEHQDGAHICFNGSKTYWKPRITLDVVIAHHPRAACLEVVVGNPETGAEAPRLYLDAKLLMNRQDQVDIRLRVEEKKEHLLRIKHSFDPDHLVLEVMEALMVTYVLSRLDIHASSSALSVFLKPQFGDQVKDEDGRLLDTVLPMQPDGIEPIKVTVRKLHHIK